MPCATTHVLATTARYTRFKRRILGNQQDSFSRPGMLLYYVSRDVPVGELQFAVLALTSAKLSKYEIWYCSSLIDHCFSPALQPSMRTTFFASSVTTIDQEVSVLSSAKVCDSVFPLSPSPSLSTLYSQLTRRDWFFLLSRCSPTRRPCYYDATLG